MEYWERMASRICALLRGDRRLLDSLGAGVPEALDRLRILIQEGKLDGVIVDEQPKVHVLDARTESFQLHRITKPAFGLDSSRTNTPLSLPIKSRVFIPDSVAIQLGRGFRIDFRFFYDPFQNVVYTTFDPDIEARRLVDSVNEALFRKYVAHAKELAEVAAERDRWAARVVELEARLAAIRGVVK